MKIIALEESVDFAILDTKKLFSKIKSHELSHKYCPNHDASFSSKGLINSAPFGGHDANHTTTMSSALEFTLPSLAVASDEQYESIPDDKITLLTRKFYALHKFCKERRRSPWDCFECGNTTHFITDCSRVRSSTPPISTTMPTGTAPATRATIRRSTASDIRRRSSNRSCPECVLP
jgi:hypothetical protein